jgi:hypothetical protein
VHSEEQEVEYVLSYDFAQEHREEALIDPINHTPRFRVELFRASAYSWTDPGMWHTVGSASN